MLHNATQRGAQLMKGLVNFADRWVVPGRLTPAVCAARSLAAEGLGFADPRYCILEERLMFHRKLGSCWPSTCADRPWATLY
jgi:hypothetical protein